MRIKTFRSLLVVCAAMALTVTAGSCGDQNERTGASPAAAKATAIVSGSIDTSTSVARTTDSDKDGDSTSKGRYDSDDRPVLSFGKPADRPTTAAIAAVVSNYYATAAAENGTAACSMLYSIYAEAVPEDYGTSPPGPAYARGTTCPAVLTAVFRHFHNELAARLPRLKVIAVRVRERQGVALLGFGASARREIRVSREGRRWKLLALVDNELP